MGLTTAMPVFLALRLVAGIVSAFILVLSSALVLERLAVAGKGALSAVHFAGVGVGFTSSSSSRILIRRIRARRRDPPDR